MNQVAYIAVMAEELKTQRVYLLMAPSEVRAVDDWRFANRLDSRGEAIRRLIRMALKADAEAK